MKVFGRQRELSRELWLTAKPELHAVDRSQTWPNFPLPVNFAPDPEGAQPTMMEASRWLLLAASTVNAVRLGGTPSMRRAMPQMVATSPQVQKDEISAENPLHVLIAGAGVGGLALANQLELSNAHVTYTVLE